MTKGDVLKLFSMLNALHPKSPHPEKNDSVVLAWSYALEPYTYDAVKDAALCRSRECRFYPDNVAELLEYLPPPLPGMEQMEAAPAVPQGEGWHVDWCREHEARCHAAGIPTATEAHRQGIPSDEWCAMAERAGV